MSLHEWFPEWSARDDWITERATRFKVSTMRRVRPDHPAISVSIEGQDEPGECSRDEAEAAVAALEADGIAAWFTPSRGEFMRLLAEWEARA